MSSFVPLLNHFSARAAGLENATNLLMPKPPAPVDIEVVRAEAFAEGVASERAERKPELDALSDKVAAIAPLVDALGTARTEALRAAADDVSSLVVALARKVIGDSLTFHPDALVGLVQGALARLSPDDEVTIRVPVAAAERVSAGLAERHKERVVADPSLTTGCIVETQHVSIDASLEAAMHGIEQATAAWLAEQG